MEKLQAIPDRQAARRCSRWCFTFLILSTTLSHFTIGAPFPALDIPDNCNINSEEKCCMPWPYTGEPVRQFQHDATTLPIRTRRPVHLLDEEEIAQLERGYHLLRELPDSDPRSLYNQANLHCLYCDNGLHYPNMSWPFEIHNGWLFLPWHRMFLYFHERILAKVLGNDSFALPYWNWDNQAPEQPYANTLPYVYAANRGSPLWNQNRNKCSDPPFVTDLNSYGGCTDKPASQLRLENTQLLYTQIVSGAPTSSLFFGMPYRYGDYGGFGPGTLEDDPHGPVHLWLGDPHAPTPYDDMGHFGRAARDPIFYPHHGNIDRIWTVWKTLPGAHRREPVDPDFLDAQFTFYDENANLIIVNVSQSIDTKLLRYEYEESPAAWITNGKEAGEEDSVPACNPTNPSQTYAMIGSTAELTEEDVLDGQPLTFRVPRHPRSRNGTEVLEIQGIKLDATLQAHWEAYLFYPSAYLNTSVSCPEFFGTLNYVPHVGQAQFNPERVWRAALGPKLVALGKENYTDIVVTLAQFGPTIQPLRFSKARIIYDDS